MIEKSYVFGGKGLWRLKFVCINEDDVGGNEVVMEETEQKAA